MQEDGDEGDDDGETPHSPVNGGASHTSQRILRASTDGPDSPQLRPAGSSALGSTILNANTEVEHFVRLQVIFWPPPCQGCLQPLPP